MLVVGCSSSSSKDDKKEEVTIQEETKPKEDASSSTQKDTSDSNQASSGSSNGSSNSNTGGSTQPPKQETPTPPKVETPPPPLIPATPTEQRGKADGVMAQINAYRQQNGLAPFTVDNYLINSSSNHAYEMAEKRALWHSGAAECITNYDDPFSAWKNSPAHNAMLLNNNRYGAVSIYYVDGYYFSVFHTSP